MEILTESIKETPATRIDQTSMIEAAYKKNLTDLAEVLSITSAQELLEAKQLLQGKIDQLESSESAVGMEEIMKVLGYLSALKQVANKEEMIARLSKRNLYDLLDAQKEFPESNHSKIGYAIRALTDASHNLAQLRFPTELAQQQEARFRSKANGI